MLRKKLFMPLLLLCLVCLQVWFLYITFHVAFIGISLKKTSAQHWTIKGFQSESVQEKLSLQIGDIIVKVNAKDPKEFVPLQKWGSLEKADSITISRNGIDHEIDMRDKVQQTIDFMSLFGEIICLCISLLIYLKIPNSKSSRFLSLVFLITGIIFMCVPASSRNDPIAKYLVSSLVAGYPLVFSHFLILFFKEKSDINLPFRWLFWLYRVIAVTVIVKLYYFTPLISYELFIFDYYGIIVFFLLGLLLNVFLFAYVHFIYRRDNPTVQSILKLIWFAFIISCAPLVFLSFIPILLYNQPIIEPLYTEFFILLFPLSFSYLIVTKQFYDINLILRRIVYTTLMSMVPTGIIVGLLAFVFNQEASFQNLSFSFLIILTIISFLLYTLEYFLTKLDAVLFPRKYHLQMALKNIAQNLKSIKSFRELSDIILVDIVNTLEVKGAVIVFQQQDGIETIVEGEIDQEEVEQYLLLSDPLDESVYSVFEINRHEEYACYLITTKKKNNTILGIEERNWLNLIISYLAVSLENVYLIRKLTMKLHELASQIPNEQAGQHFVWLRRSLFELQEQERFRLATDLHDTTMQDILLIKKRLVAYLEHEGDRQEIVGIVKHLELLNESLRQSCFDLNPYLLQRVGLVKTIEAALDLEIGSNSFETYFHADGAYEIEELDMEVKKHLFRIFQELIHNAKKHSGASKVSIKLAMMEGYICLFYKDNGVGMDIKQWEENERSRRVGSSGLGLEQMRSRIVHLNGHLELVAKRGGGVQLTVRIPIRERVVV